MKYLNVGNKLLEELCKVKQFDIRHVEYDVNIGQIKEKEKFKAAKQILFLEPFSLLMLE